MEPDPPVIADTLELEAARLEDEVALAISPAGPEAGADGVEGAGEPDGLKDTWPVG